MPTERVLVLAGAPETFEREAWIAIYDAGGGAGISHETALALWKVPGFALRPIHVTHDRPQLITPSREAVVFHRSRLWPLHHRVLLNAMPVATPTRALFDVANTSTRRIDQLRLQRSVNNAWARGLTCGEQLALMAKEWCARGRQGSAFMREYLEGHPIDWQPPESNLERRFRNILVEAGFPEPIRQRNIGDEAAWIGRVDCVDPELPLIGEVDGDTFHTAPLDRASDEARDAKLREAGFHVERFTESEVWYDKAAVIARWRRGREAARRIRDGTA